jgi:hypothetical protein
MLSENSDGCGKPKLITDYEDSTSISDMGRSYKGYQTYEDCAR